MDSMFGFLLENNIISLGVIGSHFTADLVLKMKDHFADPLFRKILPENKFKTLFGKNEDNPDEVKLGLLLRELIIWFMVIIILWALYKLFLEKKIVKMNLGKRRMN